MDSPTTSYSDLGRRRLAEIEEFLAGIELLPGQKGVVSFVGEQPVCMDVFDRSSTLALLWSGLVGSYFAGAVAAIPAPSTSPFHAPPISWSALRRHRRASTTAWA